MAKKYILILSILFINIFFVKKECMSLDAIQNQLDFNNIKIPFTDLKNHQQDVQDIINKAEQLESKVQSDKDTLKTLVDQKKAEYIEAKRNYNSASRQLKAVQAVKRKLQNGF